MSDTQADRLSNVEFVTELMQFSRFGALAQAFVIDAISQHANAIAATDNPEAFTTGLFDGQVWVDCAKDIKKKMDENYGRDL